MTSCMAFGKYMELYALIGVAVITVVVLGRKLTRRLSAPMPTVIIKPFNPTRVPKGIPDSMDIDEQLLRCSPPKPQQPPSPMSTSSSEDFVMDPDYIK